METSIIELKESDSNLTENVNNGTYSISLKKSLVLNDGDELVIKNAFIDTIASSGGLIVIEDDFTVSVDFCRGFTFNTDINSNDGTKQDTLKEKDGNSYIVDNNATDQRHLTCKDERNHNINKGDGLSYFQLDPNVVDNTGGNFSTAESITFVSDYSDNSGPDYGGVQINFYYKDSLGQIQDGYFQLTNPRGNGVSDKSTTDPLGGFSFTYDTTYKGDSTRGGTNFNGVVVTNSPSDLRDKHHVNPLGFIFNSNPTGAGDIYNLKKDTISFVIKKGAYDPNQIARIITDNMVKATLPFTSFDSSFRNEKPFGSKIYDYPNNRRTISGDFFNQFICQTSECLLTIEDGNITRPMCGCNQFSFVFDSDTQTFKFVSLHSPYYINTGTDSKNPVYSIGQQYSVRLSTQPPPTLTDQTPFIDSKQGEIILLNLTAVDSQNNPVDFWFGKLGLNPNILVNPNNHKSFSLGPGITAQVPKLNYQNGVNSTDVLIGSDAIFPKGVFVPIIDNFTAGSKLVNLMTTSIFGQKTLGQITDANGYFLIKITGYNNDSRIYSKSDIDIGISAIISRYYASTAYTNGYISDSIIYQHRGEPITISDFNISILDPDKKPSKDIGNDSNIFLMIERAEPELNNEEKK